MVTALADGPLGVVRLVPRRLHLVLDGVVIVALAASPLAMGRDRTLTAVIVAEAAALALARLATSTRRQLAPTGDTTDAEQTADPAPANHALPGFANRPAPARVVGSARALGTIAAGARRQAPAAERAFHDGARRLGRLVGRSRR